jgi:hypothetical protein
MLLINDAEVRQVLAMDECIGVMERARLIIDIF